MWILMKKTYSGELGIFAADQQYDLPKATANELLKNKLCRKTRAPWDKGKDFKAAKARELIAKAKVAISAAEGLAARLTELDEILASTEQEIKAKQQELIDAYKKAKALAGKAEIDWPPKVEAEQEQSEKADGEPKTDQPEGPGESSDSKNAADTEGQTVSAGQES